MSDLVKEVSAGGLSENDIKVLTQSGIVPKDTPSAQIMVFARICKEKGISPFSKEVYLVAHWSNADNCNKYTPITGIDGYRAIANRGGALAGCSAPMYDLKTDGSYKKPSDYKTGEKPITCTVIVYKIVQGVKCEFYGEIVVSEFNTGKQKWASMFFQMCAKTAEAHALRKGFGGELAGIFMDSELGAINNEVPTQEREKELITEYHPFWDGMVYRVSNGKMSAEKIINDALVNYSMSEETQNKLRSYEKQKGDENTTV